MQEKGHETLTSWHNEVFPIFHIKHFRNSGCPSEIVRLWVRQRSKTYLLKTITAAVKLVASACETQGKGGRATDFTRVHLHVRSTLGGQGGSDAARQAASAERRDDGRHVRQVLQDLQTNRRVS